MYEWSKEVIEKINAAKCLTESELRETEIALRMHDINTEILDEALGLSDDGKYELKYKIL